MASRNRTNSHSPSSIEYRRRAARAIPSPIGVYALCDLDGVPVYVGQSTDGIRARVNRHITSARSDVIANRLIDVWEIAYVRCWPVSDKAQLDQLEAYLFHKFHQQSAFFSLNSLSVIMSLKYVRNVSVPVPASRGAFGLQMMSLGMTSS